MTIATLLRPLSLVLATAALLLAAAPSAAALDPQPQPSPKALARAWRDAESQLAQARADRDRLRGQPPAGDGVFDLSRHELQLASADFRFRDAARKQQVVVYALATDPDLEAATRRLLPAEQAEPVREVIEGLRALWRSAGIDDFSAVRVRQNRRFTDSAPIDQLFTFYRESGARYSIDWTYLAAINYVESDFGRVNGPSSAGALGPMQFMPATWQEFGQGGDIMSPRDSIAAAARYLKAMGGPLNMDRAIYRYNNDGDYVTSIKSFAAAFRADPGWLERMYYWSTAG